MAAWIRNVALPVDCGRTMDAFPGRVTLRRLNRTEYNNTIRDLVGVDFQPADQFPDRRRRVRVRQHRRRLTIPPVLFERYLEAADEIAVRAIAAGTKSPPRSSKFPTEPSARPTARRGEVDVSDNNHGSSSSRSRPTATRRGPSPARWACFLTEAGKGRQRDRQAARSPDVQRGRHADEGKQKLAVKFLNDYYKPDDADPKMKGDRNLRIVEMTLIGPLGSCRTSCRSHTNRSSRRPRGPRRPARSSRSRAAKINVEAFATKAFRRPAKPEEVARPMKFVESAPGGQAELRAGDAAGGHRHAHVTAASCFKIEQDPLTQPVRPLEATTSWRRGSRTYCGAVVRTTSSLAVRRRTSWGHRGLKQQVQRMLKDPRSKSLSENFAAQWLHLRLLDRASPDPKRLPNFDARLREAMRTETTMFFDTIVREDRSIQEFLTADYTFVNGKLAGLYGIQNISGDQFQKIPLDTTQRGGLMGQASILTVTSNPDPDVAGEAGQVDPGEPARRSAAAGLRQRSAAGRAGPQGKERESRCGSGWRSIARTRPARRATRSWIRSASAWRTTTPSASGGPRTGRTRSIPAGASRGKTFKGPADCAKSWCRSSATSGGACREKLLTPVRN